MSDVTIYTKPACHHCNIVKTQFKKHGVEYDEINIAENPEASETIMKLGFTQAPVVMSWDDQFSGADAEGIRRFVEEYGTK